MLPIKILGIWILLAGVAILNGVMREKILTPALGPHAALPLSGILLSLFIVAVVFLIVPFIGATSATQYWLVGGIWVVLTIAFELVFGHYVMGKAWNDVLQVFNILKGNLMPLVLVATIAAPYLAARLRGLI